MATKNDITGDSIRSKTSSDNKYAIGWENIWGQKKSQTQTEKKKNKRNSNNEK